MKSTPNTTNNEEIFFANIHPYLRGYADLIVAALDVLTGGTAVYGHGFFSAGFLILRVVLLRFIKKSTSKTLP